MEIDNTNFKFSRKLECVFQLPFDFSVISPIHSNFTQLLEGNSNKLQVAGCLADFQTLFSQSPGLHKIPLRPNGMHKLYKARA